MSECYVCGNRFEKVPVAKIPMCVGCQPKATKIPEKIVTVTPLRPPVKRYHAKYVKSGHSLPTEEKIIEEGELRLLLWEGNKVALGSKGNGPHYSLPGNIFWQEVTDDPKAKLEGYTIIDVSPGTTKLEIPDKWDPYKLHQPKMIFVDYINFNWKVEYEK